MNTKRVAILCNPFAGRGQAVNMAKEAEAFVIKKSWHVVFNEQSTHAGHIEQTLSKQLADAVDLVILIGGDGTLRELITGLRKHQIAVEIAFIPMGNANVVARELHIPLSPKKALSMLDASTTTSVDIGILNSENTEPIVFLAMLEIGFGAAIVHSVTRLRLGKLQRLYQLWGDLVYAIAGLLALIKPNATPTCLHTQKNGGNKPEHAQIESTHIIIANMKTYAKGWSLTPSANCQDGLLDVAYSKKNSPFSTMATFLNAAKSPPSPSAAMHYLHLNEAWLTGSNTAFMQLDGDPVMFSGSVHVTLEKSAFIIHTPLNM